MGTEAARYLPIAQRMMRRTKHIRVPGYFRFRMVGWGNVVGLTAAELLGADGKSHVDEL